MPLAKTKFYLKKQKVLVENTQALERENDREMSEVGRLEKRVSDLEQHMNPDLRTPMDEKPTFRECSACEQRLFKELENIPALRELQDQVEKFRYCLLECKNQNLLLKRDLQVAKKVVCQELGIENVDFNALLRHASEEGWKGRRAKILHLKNKNFELRDKLQEKKLNNEVAKSSASEEYARQNIGEDRKSFWRMELEKRKAFEMVGKEKDDLAEELVSVRKKLQTCQSRNRELMEEISILRGELYAMAEKNRDDAGLIISMRNMEQQLKESLCDRSELRRVWDGAKSRNIILDDQVKLLKEQVSVLKDKNDEDVQIIQSLSHQQQRLQALLEREQMLNHQQAENYKDDLRKMHANHSANIEFLSKLQTTIDEKSEMIEILQQQIAEIEAAKLARNQSLQDEADELEARESQESKVGAKDKDEPPEQEGEEGEEEKEEKEGDLKELQMEIAKFRTLYEATQQDSDNMTQIISELHTRVEDLTVQILDTQRVALERDLERKDLQGKIKRLQQDIKEKKKKKGWEKTKPGPSIAKTKTDELIVKLEVMAEENDFLRNFLTTAISAKQEDFQLYRNITDKAKERFEASLDEIKTELTQKEEAPDEEGEEGEEGEEET